jgi:hypothetical protein
MSTLPRHPHHTMHNVTRYGSDGHEIENVAIEIYVIDDYIHLHAGGSTPKRYLIPITEWQRAVERIDTHE